MKRFLAYCKSHKTAIIEVECQLITREEDPSISWLLPGEFKARILKPEFLLKLEKEAGNDKQEIFYYSAYLFPTLHDAEHQMAILLKEKFEWLKQKYDTPYSQKELEKAIRQVEVILL